MLYRILETFTRGLKITAKTQKLKLQRNLLSITRSIDVENRQKWQVTLLSNPQMGDVIQGTGGARKIRIQLDGRGKSGGGRVIYLDVFEKEKLYLLFAYPKNMTENLTEEQKQLIKRLVDAIKKE